MGSKFDSRLADLAGGDLKAAGSLTPGDIDNLGDFYIEKIFRNIPGNAFAKKLPGQGGWTDAQFPASINVFRNKYDGILDALKMPTSEKREFLREWYRLMAKRKQGGLPDTFWKDYRQNLAGFTDDVINEDLLKEYPTWQPLKE